MNNKIEIIVFASGGVVQAVQANVNKKDINVTVCDWDNYEPEYDENGSGLRRMEKRLAKIRENNKMKYVW